MGVGAVNQAQPIGQGQCGCGGPEVSMAATTGESRFGRDIWKVTIRNDEPKSVFVTLAVSECVGGDKDFDTHGVDQKIAAGCSHTFEIARGGNGYAAGSNVRATVKDGCGDAVGLIKGELSDC